MPNCGSFLKIILLKGESIEGNVLLTKIAASRNAIRLLVKQIEWTFSHLEWLQRRKKISQRVCNLYEIKDKLEVTMFLFILCKAK